MKYRVVSSAEMFAAQSFAPSDFLNEPCGNCSDGKGQHRPLRSERQGKLVHTGKCTRPGCDCPGYESPEQFYGS
jgi:hypothetical protein